MSASEEEGDALAIEVVQLALKVLPLFDTVIDSRSAKMSRALWPRGAPRRVTWVETLRAEAGVLQRRMDAIVEADLRRLGGTVRPETLVRMQRTHETIARVAQADPEFLLDRLLSAGDEPRHLGQLMAASRSIIVSACRIIAERQHAGRRYTVDLARGVVEMLRELLDGVLRAARAIDDKALIEAFAPLRDTLDPVVAELEPFLSPDDDAFEPITDEEWLPKSLPSEPAVPPAPPEPEPDVVKTPPPQEVAGKLETLCQHLRRVQGTVGEAIVRELFEGQPPEAVTWTLVMEAINEAAATPLEQRGAHRDALHDVDQLLFADGAAESVAELVSRTLDAVAHAARTLAGHPPEGVEQYAAPVWLQSSMLLLNLVAAAQFCGEQLAVVDVARALGLDAVPLPGAAPPRDLA